ncbi:MAG: WecB/TagA/CpsF family glycosyltransferase [Flavobacteriales bacterium]|nr:WecB/TagA/CpsF family glycosyltransferase [Flavobacteriales bacterium]
MDGLRCDPGERRDAWLGGTFLLYAGLDTRAPKWMRDLSLEWAYRLVLEPRRLWKRYLVTNTLFLGLVARYAWLRLKAPSRSRTRLGSARSHPEERCVGNRGMMHRVEELVPPTNENFLRRNVDYLRPRLTSLSTPSTFDPLFGSISNC